ncbi:MULTISPECIES: Scr1 family TA system antitoxin-like transcriptional regulator [unclassified Streptomyces]|nr:MULTISPECIES: Scr1 family TA system antitoxin-like transcriptional regulator [unclassified Streptomyces]
MVAQLEHLMTSVRSPDITVQVLPYSAGASPSHLPLTLVSANGKPHAVYTETPTHGGRWTTRRRWWLLLSARSTACAWRLCLNRSRWPCLPRSQRSTRMSSTEAPPAP